MILNTKENIFLKDFFPFRGEIDEENETITFLDGNVIDVFSNAKVIPLNNEDFFSDGSRVIRVQNTDIPLPYNKNNTYYLEIYETEYGIFKVKIVIKGEKIPKIFQTRNDLIKEAEEGSSFIDPSLVVLFEKGEQIINSNYFIFSPRTQIMGGINLIEWQETNIGANATLKINKTMFIDVDGNTYTSKSKRTTVNFNLKEDIPLKEENAEVLFTFIYISEMPLKWGNTDGAKEGEPYFEFLKLLKRSYQDPPPEPDEETPDPIGDYGSEYLNMSGAKTNLEANLEFHKGRLKIEDYVKKKGEYKADTSMKSVPQYIFGGYIYKCGIVTLETSDHDTFIPIEGQERKGSPSYWINPYGPENNGSDSTVDIEFF